VSELASQDAVALGNLIHLNEHHGQALLNAAKQFPALLLKYDLRPLSHDVLKIAIQVRRAFTWNNKVHGTTESFWVWVEDDEGVSILQLAHLLFRHNTESHSLDFVVSIPETGPPPSMVVRYVSDRWMGAEEELWIPLDALVMPIALDVHTPLLDLPLLPASVVSNNITITKVLDHIRLEYLNPIQTQVFWSLFTTQCHALICAPTGCGKSTLAQLLIWCAPPNLNLRMLFVFNHIFL
jgi:antiviral helicase SLH1